MQVSGWSPGQVLWCRWACTGVVALLFGLAYGTMLPSPVAAQQHVFRISFKDRYSVYEGVLVTNGSANASLRILTRGRYVDQKLEWRQASPSSWYLVSEFALDPHTGLKAVSYSPDKFLVTRQRTGLVYKFLDVSSNRWLPVHVESILASKHAATLVSFRMPANYRLPMQYGSTHPGPALGNYLPGSGAGSSSVPAPDGSTYSPWNSQDQYIKQETMRDRDAHRRWQDRR